MLQRNVINFSIQLLWLLQLSSYFCNVSAEERCNLCGCTPCRFTNENAVVEWETPSGGTSKSRCGYLQRGIEERGEQDETYCRTVIWKSAWEPCGCVNRDNVALTSIEGTSDVGFWLSCRHFMDDNEAHRLMHIVPMINNRLWTTRIR